MRSIIVKACRQSDGKKASILVSLERDVRNN